MSSLASPEVQAIREQAIRDAIERLTNRTHDVATIGARVLVWRHALASADKRPKLLTLAQRLGVSSPRASQAVASAEGAILDLRTVTIPFSS
jgi:hypothetical protein